jgi:hypothetical protein
MLKWQRTPWSLFACVAGGVAWLACSAGGDRRETTGSSASGGSGPSGSGAGGGSVGIGVGVGGGGGMGNACKVQESTEETLPPCEESAPPDSFTPAVQWEWTAPDTGTGYNGSIVQALVGNFTDDNNDGEIDLCDVPDVLVTAADSTFSPGAPGTIYMLAGDTGALELAFPNKVDPNITPAFADIDGDSLPEIVAVNPSGQLVAFEHDGALKWTGATGTWSVEYNSYCTALAIYDLENDGSIEILGGFDVFDAQGQKKWGLPPPGGDYWCPTPTAADLDGDGILEVVFGHAAYHANGTVYWQLQSAPGHPHIANFDSDMDPEILLHTGQGMQVVEHNGTVKFGPVRPTGGFASANCWGKPGVVHDFDGDGHADAATGSCTDYSVYTITSTATPKWTAAVMDASGLATGTGFDFLSDSVADAIYTDEHTAFVFDGATGALELSVPRSSGTLIEYPVVADVDNDGSAEIVIVNNWGWFGQPIGPTVTVIRDEMDRWIQARRIWNQHAYHVTNIREDARLPMNPKKNWLQLNTFRANSQIEGVDCDPGTPR